MTTCVYRPAFQTSLAKDFLQSPSDDTLRFRASCPLQREALRPFCRPLLPSCVLLKTAGLPKLGARRAKEHLLEVGVARIIVVRPHFLRILCGLFIVATVVQRLSSICSNTAVDTKKEKSNACIISLYFWFRLNLVSIKLKNDCVFGTQE